MSRTRRLNLVSVKSAKALGLKVHGSTANMPDWDSLCHPWAPLTKDLKKYNYLRWLQAAPMQSLDGDPVILPRQPHAPNDNYCGVASIPFPSIGRDGQHDSGLWCRGCEWACENLLGKDEQEIGAALSYSIPPDCYVEDVEDVEDVLLSLALRARSKIDFASHIQNCYGVKKLADDVDGRGIYCVQAGNRVHYLTIPTTVFDDDTMGKPFLLIPQLPDFPDTNWTRMTIPRKENGTLAHTISFKTLPELKFTFHENLVDCLSYRKIRRLRPGVVEVHYRGRPAMAKYSCFDWDFYRIQRENWAYDILHNDHDKGQVYVAPRVLGRQKTDVRSDCY
ncbi:hypothetical protein Z517_11511 [Fonsecaea pedrosoi CBS 271.37]|uniref:Unplaced genomic scaffold supercont1.8, whole genome shotgun sequence n=1 Tax=Fonsecaea pedrosoi CBS 271.37 TaxID=1442368 RepID=A0A0D2DAU2_9EURO|nr:uncharacterized protein Z517_11511 [Fonsecaea pedrosoi CBS 271.37]KIW74741.1 hypothetical protein Z517_11511 [Fonsecaea pedrosoi CBS 271.37]